MRVSLIGTTLALTVAALAVGCGAQTRMAMMPTGTNVQSLAKDADPFAQIRKVAQQIWDEMETSDFESNSQCVSSQSAGSPKYAFLNIASDKQDETTVLYRAGTYAMATQKTNVQVSFVTSAAARKRQDPALVAAATRAIKTAVRDQYGHPVSELMLSPQATGPKYAFIAVSKNQPDPFGGSGTIDWYLPGTFATSSKNVDVFFGIGHGSKSVNTATNYYMDKTTRKSGK